MRMYGSAQVASRTYGTFVPTGACAGGGPRGASRPEERSKGRRPWSARWGGACKKHQKLGFLSVGVYGAGAARREGPRVRAESVVGSTPQGAQVASRTYGTFSHMRHLDLREAMRARTGLGGAQDYGSSACVCMGLLKSLREPTEPSSPPGHAQAEGRGGRRRRTHQRALLRRRPLGHRPDYRARPSCMLPPTARSNGVDP